MSLGDINSILNSNLWLKRNFAITWQPTHNCLSPLAWPSHTKSPWVPGRLPQPPPSVTATTLLQGQLISLLWLGSTSRLKETGLCKFEWPASDLKWLPFSFKYFLNIFFSLAIGMVLESEHSIHEFRTTFKLFWLASGLMHHSTSPKALCLWRAGLHPSQHCFPLIP